MRLYLVTRSRCILHWFNSNGLYLQRTTTRLEKKCLFYSLLLLWEDLHPSFFFFTSVQMRKCILLLLQHEKLALQCKRKHYFYSFDFTARGVRINIRDEFIFVTYLLFETFTKSAPVARESHGIVYKPLRFRIF